MKRLRTVRTVAVVLLVVSLFCTVDLGLNVLYNTETWLHDGSYTICSILHGIFGIFGDSLWSFERFFAAFRSAVWISFGLLAVNVVLRFVIGRKTDGMDS